MPTLTQRNINFSIILLCNTLCTSLYNSLYNFVVVQFYLRARQNEFHVVTNRKYIAQYILWRYVHFRIFALAFIYFLPCLSKYQWNVDKNKTYLKLKRNVIYHLHSNSRPYRHFCNSCIDGRVWACNLNAFFYTFYLFKMIFIRIKSVKTEKFFFFCQKSFSWSFKLLISYFPNKIKLSLFF